MTPKKNSKELTAIFMEGGAHTQNDCIWMRAGLVDFRQCDNAFDCGSCPFDTGMQKKMAKEPLPSKTDTPASLAEALFLRYRQGDLPCRHYLSGRIPVMKTCPNAYACGHCEFDQWLDQADESENAATGHAPKTRLNLAAQCYHHLGHMWVRVLHGGKIRIGLDDYFIKTHGSLEEIGLPSPGSKIKEGKPHIQVRHPDKTATPVHAPVTGTVLLINHQAVRHPEIVFDDPYGRGWLVIVSPDMPKTSIRHLTQLAT